MFGAGSQLVVIWESVEFEKRVTIQWVSQPRDRCRPRLRIVVHRSRLLSEVTTGSGVSASTNPRVHGAEGFQAHHHQGFVAAWKMLPRSFVHWRSSSEGSSSQQISSSRNKMDEPGASRSDRIAKPTGWF